MLRGHLLNPAQYLLRFDDLCPTMDRQRWQRYRVLIEEFGLRPILAVVPDNQDRELVRSKSNPQFWDEMRELASAGSTIALHGYQHSCRSRGASLLGLHRHSEFAGVKAEIQRQWIEAGIKLLRAQGLDPRVFVAPRHGFDRNTLDALESAGLRILSDGFARQTWRRNGILFVPQQLWKPLHKTHGLWTICAHPNTSRQMDVEQLRRFVAQHRAQFTSMEEVARRENNTDLHLLENLYATSALCHIRLRRMLRKLRRRQHLLPG